ncbi:hypothetical protein CGGC5_v012577 [Colletotrichum fructicola Nara gc5]|uniref:Uncharacterized protein n=1 Tax=Colletotrichum fructicola (strain Nara gc5) TaxID=1213859 RepID=A0A7J6IR47_COLFN|nr:hypothetical protein CGGC5_v012577 [Colletotrichum fructicola Nara gc5]
MPDSRQAASPSLPASVPAATNTGPRRGVPESPRADQSNLHLFGGSGGGGGGGLRATATATESYMGAMRMVITHRPSRKHDSTTVTTDNDRCCLSNIGSGGAAGRDAQLSASQSHCGLVMVHT